MGDISRQSSEPLDLGDRWFGRAGVDGCDTIMVDEVDALATEAATGLTIFEIDS